MTKKDINKGKIVIYKSSDGPKLDIKLSKQTVWLTQKQMSELFNKDVKTINEHIINIYKQRELNHSSTILKFQIVQTEGDRSVTRNVDFYNLDMIISVGYRVSSKRAT